MHASRNRFLQRRRTPRAGLAVLVMAASAHAAFALAPGQLGTALTFPVSGTSDTVMAAAADPDGSVTMAGTASSGGYGALARVTPAGGADGMFGGAGVGYYVYDLSHSLPDSENALVRMGSGQYAACGVFFSGATTATDFVTIRFNADGSLDPSFNGGGFAVTPYLASGAGAALYDQCNAVGVQSDGKIVSAGYTNAVGSARIFITRHDTNGMLDSAFGSGGKVLIDASLSPASDSVANALAVLPDDKLLIAGQAGSMFGNIDFLLMRLNADGTPDTAFGSGGIVRTAVGTNADIAYAIAVQPDGRIVLAGSSIAADGRNDFALARYNANGTLDATFGSGGVVTTPVGPAEDIAHAVAVMPWGRIVAAGSARISTTAQGTNVAVVAYNADGSLDRYFGNAGKVYAQITAQPDEVIQALAVDVAHERFWALGGGVPSTDRDFMVLEFGLPDTIFRDGFEGVTP